MTRSLCAEQQSDPEAFADGLGDWIAGRDTEAGDTAGLIVADTFLAWRRRVKSGQ
jgi:hypothetical protein